MVTRRLSEGSLRQQGPGFPSLTRRASKIDVTKRSFSGSKGRCIPKKSAGNANTTAKLGINLLEFTLFARALTGSNTLKREGQPLPELDK